MIFSHNLQESSIHFRPTVISHTIVSSLLVSNIFTMSQEAIFNMKGWFLARGLPWSESLSEQLSHYGVECVEGLNLFLKEQFVDLLRPRNLLLERNHALCMAVLWGRRFVLLDVGRIFCWIHRNQLNQLMIPRVKKIRQPSFMRLAVRDSRYSNKKLETTSDLINVA